MRIEKFAYKDLETGWELEETRFDALNLLVGISGVGKTRIIEALRTAVSVAIEKPRHLPHARWSWTFDDEGVDYRWEAETAPDSDGNRSKRVFTRERVERLGKELIDRTTSHFVYEGGDFPKLDPTTSAIDLLDGEDRVEPIGRAMELLIFSLFSGDNLAPSTPFDVPPTWDLKAIFERVREDLESHPRLEIPMGADRTVVSKNVFVFDLFLMQRFYPRQFEELCSRFREVFPTVSEIRVERDRLRFRLDIREGPSMWIPQSRISSGMLKTLVYLYELDASPPGSVILIDEFEASLGLNCLPAMTEALLARGDCQFIVTSHHPYVINNIPIEHWKLVERNRSVVRLVSARDIPALNSASHHEAFLRLINLDRYAHGIR